jgi:WD repeat-containing protein 35
LHLQGGDTKAAIDCCVLLHQWDQALQLAQQYNYPQAEGLLQQYAGHLLEKKKYLEAVELYRKVRDICVAPGAAQSAAPLCCNVSCLRMHDSGQTPRLSSAADEMRKVYAQL